MYLQDDLKPVWSIFPVGNTTTTMAVVGGHSVVSLWLQRSHPAYMASGLLGIATCKHGIPYIRVALVRQTCTTPPTQTLSKMLIVGTKEKYCNGATRLVNIDKRTPLKQRKVNIGRC